MGALIVLEVAMIATLVVLMTAQVKYYYIFTPSFNYNLIFIHNNLRRK